MRILNDFSLEMTGKDVAGLEEAAPLIPPGTRVNVTFLGNEDQATRVAAAASVSRLGFVPVPHISARRLRSKAEFQGFLDDLASVGAVENVFVVGGDPSEPFGPYEDSLALIRSGLLEPAGVKHVSIAGYPEGHPDIDRAVLWGALEDKTSALSEQSLDTTILTQFGFNVEPVTAWIDGVRSRGIDAPIRIGVPGPAGVKRLLGYARRFGVASSAGIVQKYGFSITNLMGTAGPDRFISDLAAEEPAADVGLHFYTFGGLSATSEWIRKFSRLQGIAAAAKDAI